MKARSSAARRRGRTRSRNPARGPLHRVLATELLEGRLLLAVGAFGSDGFSAKTLETITDVDLGLASPAPMNRLEISVTAEAFGLTRSDSDTATVTGNMLVDLGIDFDAMTGDVSSVDELTFTGGRIHLSNVSLTLDYGFLLGRVEASGKDISGAVSTPDPPGAVTDGTFDTAEHLVTLDDGEFHAHGTGAIGGMFDPITIYLADNPIQATTEMTGFIEASLNSVVGQTATYDATLTLPVDFEDEVYNADGVVVTVAVSGTLEAAGQFTRILGQPATVAGRYVFYNDSCFDGNDPLPNADDDDAVPPCKQALLPGQTATFENYTSYNLGINGIMIDVANLVGGPTGAFSADDFEFRVGNNDDPGTWPLGPDPSYVTVRPGDGAQGSHRVTVIWPHNAIANQWLQVTVLANDDTGLAEDDVFYFGNAIGDTGNSTTDAKVNAIDMLGARDNTRPFINPPTICDPFDFNRDCRVNAVDMLIARNNQTHFLNALKLITVPGSKAAEAANSGTIRGSKFNDLDGDGQWDRHEPGLPGWTIYLDLNHNGRLDPQQPGLDGEIEPDDFPIGPIVDPTRFVILRESLHGMTVLSVPSLLDPLPSPERVFGWGRGPLREEATWSEETAVLEVAFAEPVGGVSLEFIGPFRSGHQGRLRLFDTAGRMLDERLTDVIWGPNSQTLRVDREANDIARLQATGTSDFSPLMLDKLRFSRRAEPGEPSTETDADGGYEFADLDGGTYVVAEQPQTGWRQTFPTAARGPEFAVSPQDGGPHSSPQMAMDARGNFVVAWLVEGRLGDGSEVYARRFLADGTPAGDEFPVNTHTDGDQVEPAVAVDPNGDFVVTWSSYGQDGSDWGVYAQRYYPDGQPNGREFPVNTTTKGPQSAPSVAMDPTGGFVIAWMGTGPDPGGPEAPPNQSVYAQRFDADGTPQGREFRVSSSAEGTRHTPSVAISPQGDIVIAYAAIDRGVDPAIDPFGMILARMFDAQGIPHGDEFRVDTIRHQDDSNPSVAMDAVGNFVVVFDSDDLTDGPGWADVHARLYDARGNPRGPDFQVNPEEAFASHRSTVAMDAAGRFVVAWMGPGGGFTDVFARTFRPDGSPFGDEFFIPIRDGGIELDPAVAVDDAGGIVAAWAVTGDFWWNPAVIARRLVDFGFQGTHRVVVEPGGTVEDVDFGNRRQPEVVGRHVFYNNSAFDDNDPAPNAADDRAIAPDKQALLPGQTATFANYTSFSGGINGIMVDGPFLPVADWPPRVNDYLAFKVGNDDDPANWDAAPRPRYFTLRPGEGVDGSDRLTVIWSDAAIQKQWLQVTVLAGAHTGLRRPDVFYYGNAIGESGNSTTDAKVNSIDILAARDNPRGFLDPAEIDFFVDFNRDARVNAIDMLIARDNSTHFLDALRLITARPGTRP